MKIIAIAEVAVDRPARHPGALGNLLQRGALETFFPDQLAGGTEKLGAGAGAFVPFLAALWALWRWCRMPFVRIRLLLFNIESIL